MKKRDNLIKLGFALFFILLSPYVLAELMVDYKYIQYSDNQQTYLNSERTVYTGERTVDELLTPGQGISIELRITDGSLIEVKTELVTGEIDVDIFLVVLVNASSEEVSGYSMNIGSSREHITVETNIKRPSLDRLIFTRFPLAFIRIIPVTGSGIISLQYQTLHPVSELTYLCIITLFVGVSFFVKNAFDLIEIKRSKKRF